MTLTYAQVIQLTETLQRMVTLTGDAGHAIARSLMALSGEYQVVMQCKGAIFKKYGEEQPDGSYVVRDASGHKEDFVREINELMAREVDVQIYKLPRDKFNMDEMECSQAQAIDYLVFQEMMVDKPEVTS